MVPGAKVLSNLAGCRAYNERWDREKVFYGRRDQRELSGGYRLNGIRIPYIPPRGQGAVGLGIRRSFEPDYQNKSYVRQGPIPWHEKQGGYTIPYRNGQRQFGEEQYLHNPPPPIEYPPPTIRPMIGPTMEPLGPFDPRGGPMDMGLYSPPSGPRFPPPGPRFPPRWGGSSSSDSDYTDSDTALSLIHSDFRPNGYERIRRPYRPHHSPDEFPRGFIPDPDEGMYDGRAYGGGRVFGPLDQDVYRTGIDYGDNRARRRSDIYRNDSDDSF